MFLDFTYGPLPPWMFSEPGFLGLGQLSTHYGGSYVHTFCFFLSFFFPHTPNSKNLSDSGVCAVSHSPNNIHFGELKKCQERCPFKGFHCHVPYSWSQSKSGLPSNPGLFLPFMRFPTFMLLILGVSGLYSRSTSFRDTE